MSVHEQGPDGKYVPNVKKNQLTTDCEPDRLITSSIRASKLFIHWRASFTRNRNESVSLRPPLNTAAHVPSFELEQLIELCTDEIDFQEPAHPATGSLAFSSGR